MAEYLGRTSSCTSGTRFPDHNLSSYAAANGFTTALLGVAFKGAGRPVKIYTYWGHTGIKRGDYIEVLVPRGSKQETVIVRVQAVLPADAMKVDGYTAKHMHRMASRPAEASKRPPLVGTYQGPSGLLESWINTTSLRIAPFALSPHARECIDAINKVLGAGTVADYDLHKPLVGHKIHTAIVDDLGDEKSPPERLKLTVAIPKQMGKSVAMERCAAELQAAGLNVTVPPVAADHDLVIEDVLALDKVNEQLRPAKEDRIDAMQFAFNGKIDAVTYTEGGPSLLDMKTLAEHYAGVDRSFYQQYMLQPMYSEDGQNLKRHASFSHAHTAPYGAGSCSMKTFDQHQQAYYQATVMTSPPDEFLLMHEPWRVYQWYMQQSCLRVDHVSSTGIYTILGDDSAKAIPEKARNWLQGERDQRRIREKAARLGAMYSSGPNDMLAFAKAINPEVRLHPYQEEAIIRMMAAAPPAEIKPFNPAIYTKETIVSAKIETIVYVTLPGNNARLVAKDVPASTYFDAIATLEAQIGKLELIEHKPRSLQQQVAALKTQVQELAELCDLYHAKKEPILGQSEQADSKDASGEATVSPNPGTAA